MLYLIIFCCKMSVKYYRSQVCTHIDNYNRFTEYSVETYLCIKIATFLHENMLHFEEVCRVCLRSDQELLLIFNDKNFENSIASMLEKCTKYKVFHCDGLPQHICVICSKAVKDAYNFKQNCEKSYRQLMQILANRKNDERIGSEKKEIPASYNREEKLEVRETNALHPCGNCNRKFSNINKMLIHFSNMHKGPIVCHFCSKKINCIGYLKTHIAIFHPEFRDNTHSIHKTFQKIISRRDYRLRHKNLTNRKLFADDSQVLYKSTTAVENDDTTYETDVDEQGFVEHAISIDVEPIHTVLLNDNCTSKDLKLEKLDMGLYIDPKDDESTKSEDFIYGQMFKESSCILSSTDSKKENSKTSFLDYYDYYEKRFACDGCEERFDSKKKLLVHRKTEGHNKIWLCSQCGTCLKSLATLNDHMRRHKGEKPYKCKFCNKGFTGSVEKRNHEKFHTDERSHFCEICGKGFQLKHTLNKHLRVHTGEKPYKCPHCSHAFAQSTDLKTHIRRHTGERLRCEICDASYVDGSKLRRHKITKHGIKDESKIGRVQKFISLKQQDQQIKMVQLQQLPT